jgi:predicted  nucleic acid-binding Zn-ribbon protein
MEHRIISMAVVYLLVASALSLTIFVNDGQAAKVEDIIGKDLKLTLPGARATPMFWILPGDNITVTIWNYTGPEGRATTMYFTTSDYFERSDNFVSNLNAEFNIVTGRTYVFWAILPTAATITVTLDMYDDGTAVSFEYRITRAPSEYSSEYFVGPLIEEATASLKENITNLNYVTNNLSNITGTLVSNTEDILEDITALRKSIDDINGRLVRISNESELLRLNVSMMDGAIGTLESDLRVLDTNMASLTAAYHELNLTVTGISKYLDDLRMGDVELPWLDENLSDIRLLIADLQLHLNSLYDNNIEGLNNDLSELTQRVVQLDGNLTKVKESIPTAFNASALLDRMAKLEAQNELLQDQLDDLKDEQDGTTPSAPSAAVGYFALVIGLVAMFIGIAAFLKRKSDKDKSWVEYK